MDLRAHGKLISCNSHFKVIVLSLFNHLSIKNILCYDLFSLLYIVFLNHVVVKILPLYQLVFRTVGYSGADVRNLVNEAAIMAVSFYLLSTVIANYMQIFHYIRFLNCWLGGGEVSGIEFDSDFEFDSYCP